MSIELAKPFSEYVTVKALDPSAQVHVDLASKKVVVDSSQDRHIVAKALAEAGYPAQ